MGKTVKTKVRAGKKAPHRTIRKVHTESELDLFDDISIQAKKKTLMFESPLPILSQSLDTLHYKEFRSKAEDCLLEELQEAHYARLAALVVNKDDSMLAAHKKLLLTSPRPLKKSDRNLYWAISREIRGREAFLNGDTEASLAGAKQGR